MFFFNFVQFFFTKFFSSALKCFDDDVNVLDVGSQVSFQRTTFTLLYRAAALAEGKNAKTQREKDNIKEINICMNSAHSTNSFAAESFVPPKVETCAFGLLWLYGRNGME